MLTKIDEEDDLSAKTYAVIVDEAHSSQSGETAADLKQLLGSLTPEDLDLDEDDGTPAALLARLAARGRQPNLSFFAFTATPKAKTLELFGTKGPDGKPRAFHTYSMRQAIEEKFIVDVLANYTTYEQLFRLETAAEETIEVPSGQASRRLARFTELHPYVKSQKAAVVIDHFKRVVRPLLGGQGKAMVVCESREEAVQWKRALEQEIERHAHEDVKVLVAFSGEVTIKNPEADNVGMSYTEPQMNKIAGKPLPETKLPDEFDKPGYGILIVAEKYQTGFDQPKLCGMYVDKVLTGVNAVQTLSRLNRSPRRQGQRLRARLPQHERADPQGVRAVLRADRGRAERPERPVRRRRPGPRLRRDHRRGARRVPRSMGDARARSRGEAPRDPVDLDAERLHRGPGARQRHAPRVSRSARPVRSLLRIPVPGAAVDPARRPRCSTSSARCSSPGCAARPPTAASISPGPWS